jgi:curli production assembly/transport component CsgE
VIDETLTRHGREFYTAFHQSWRSPTKQGIYTIVIREQPAPGRGTQVSVWVNDTALYRARLIPGGDVLGDHPVRAVHRTSQYVASGRAALRIF